ncbi:MAG TPA: hypothetical protein VNX21_07555 [Candidatus Thermoplasmatota archaeon]|nr:hypothetical protein [Candidatus Thermoplasmatota archaeon]
MNRPTAIAAALLASLVAVSTMPLANAVDQIHVEPPRGAGSAKYRLNYDGSIEIIELKGCQFPTATRTLLVNSVETDAAATYQLSTSVTCGPDVTPQMCTATLSAYWNDIIAHGLMWGDAHCGTAMHPCVNLIVVGCYATISATLQPGGCNLYAIELIPGASITVDCQVS